MKISPLVFEKIQKEIKSVADFKEGLDGSLAKKTTEFLDLILGGALSLGASDIHIEPEKETAKIRTRVDGVLQDVTLIELQLYETVLSRVKLLSGIKLNIAEKPQDGRFTITTAPEVAIEIRTSTLPAEYGETIVLRILNPKGLINIEGMGLRKDLFESFQKEIKKPNGMIIVTGPTGSGKTTTLYAFLKGIQRPEIKIITIEDPIEYHLKGVSQTQTQPDKGYDFATGLRSIVRQDPDVILVGEIRDMETADIALQAALTGHLVLTTLHTNDAVGTIARLTSLGVKPANIGPAINLAIAQRLARKVCSKCVIFTKPSLEELKKIKKNLANIPEKVEIPEITAALKIPKAKGCKICNFTGYKGRVGVFEAFAIDDDMEKFILTDPSSAALKDKAIQRGMVLMAQDGLIKVLEGLTTIEEIERVVGE